MWSDCDNRCYAGDCPTGYVCEDGECISHACDTFGGCAPGERCDASMPACVCIPDACDMGGYRCIDDACTAECAGDGECSALGAGAYCFGETEPGVCLAACTGPPHCQAVFGPDTTPVCFQGKCELPN